MRQNRQGLFNALPCQQDQVRLRAIGTLVQKGRLVREKAQTILIAQYRPKILENSKIRIQDEESRFWCLREFGNTKRQCGRHQKTPGGGCVRITFIGRSHLGASITPRGRKSTRFRAPQGGFSLAEARHKRKNFAVKKRKKVPHW